MRPFVPSMQAEETISMDTVRIREALSADAAREDIRELVQTAANNLRRLFEIEDIFEIIDDGTATDEMLSLKAAVMDVEQADPRIELYTSGEPDFGQGHL